MLHRISSDITMDVTDCVSNRGSMECYENRLRTFDTYPKQMLPDKFQLARELDCIIQVNRTFVSAFDVSLNRAPGKEMTMRSKNTLNGHQIVNT